MGFWESGDSMCDPSKLASPPIFGAKKPILGPGLKLDPKSHSKPFLGTKAPISRIAWDADIP
jgi:hypothetical protein